jgi:hypothetical protein
LAACADPAPTPSSSPFDGAEWPRCGGDRYSVAYPPGWFVHPPDEGQGIGACQLFGSEPFSEPAAGNWVPSSEQITLWRAEGCRGSFDELVSKEEADVGGYPGWRHVVRPGLGDRTQRGVEYFVTLLDHDRCEQDVWFVARTESISPGSFEENISILDEMISTILFED